MGKDFVTVPFATCLIWQSLQRVFEASEAERQAAAYWLFIVLVVLERRI